MADKQLDVNPTERDYAFLDYFRKAMMNDTHPCKKEIRLQMLKFNTGIRDYYIPSLRQIDHLIQIDEKPNLELMEPKWELYKISISFQQIDTRKLYKIVTSISDHHLTMALRTILRGSKNERVQSSGTFSKCRGKYQHGCFLQ